MSARLIVICISCTQCSSSFVLPVPVYTFLGRLLSSPNVALSPQYFLSQFQSSFLVSTSCRRLGSPFIPDIYRRLLSSPFIAVTCQDHLMTPFFVAILISVPLLHFSLPFLLLFLVSTSSWQILSLLIVSIYRRHLLASFRSPILVSTSLHHLSFLSIAVIYRQHLSLSFFAI